MKISTRIVTLLLLNCAIYHSAFSQQDSCQTLATKFLDTVREHSCAKNSMDWSTARGLFMEEKSEIKNQAELKPHFEISIHKIKNEYLTNRAPHMPF